jgi:hypothetical protein
VGGVLTTGGLQYTGEVEAGGGDLVFFGVGGLDFPSCAFCCCLHLARLFLNQTYKTRKQTVQEASYSFTIAKDIKLRRFANKKVQVESLCVH